MEQVENFEENSDTVIFGSSSGTVYEFPSETSTMMVAESTAPYGTKKDE